MYINVLECDKLKVHENTLQYPYSPASQYHTYVSVLVILVHTIRSSLKTSVGETECKIPIQTLAGYHIYRHTTGYLYVVLAHVCHDKSFRLEAH